MFYLSAFRARDGGEDGGSVRAVRGRHPRRTGHRVRCGGRRGERVDHVAHHALRHGVGSAPAGPTPPPVVETLFSCSWEGPDLWCMLLIQLRLCSRIVGAFVQMNYDPLKGMEHSYDRGNDISGPPGGVRSCACHGHH